MCEADPGLSCLGEREAVARLSQVCRAVRGLGGRENNFHLLEEEHPGFTSLHSCKSFETGEASFSGLAQIGIFLPEIPS